MKAVDVMTRNVVSVKLDSSVFEAAQLMILNRISGLPVLDTSGKLAGVVTEVCVALKLQRRDAGLAGWSSFSAKAAWRPSISARTDARSEMS
jgi:CBS-domain-containing membrane protein